MICFVCGETMSPADRIAVTGHLPPSRPGQRQDPTIRLHRACAVTLAAELLRPDPPAEGPRRATAEEIVALTEREQQVLERIVAGDTNRQIGMGLGLAEKTVKNTITEILAKLGAVSRTEAAVVAVRLGLVRDEDAAT